MDTAAQQIDYDINDYKDSASGTRVTLYLDPEAPPRVFTLGFIGWGVFRRRLLDISPRDLGTTQLLAVVSDSLEGWLRDHESELRALAACYEGAYWDGNNHVGRWSDDLDELLGAWEEQLSDAITSHDIHQYWDAAGWFAVGDPHRGLCVALSVVDEAIEAGDIETYAAGTVASHRADIGVHMEQDDVERVIRYLLEQELEQLVEWDLPEGIDWVVPPVDQGQIVEVAYSRGMDDGGCYYYRRTRDRADGLTYYDRIDADDVSCSWEPWQHEPAIEVTGWDPQCEEPERAAKIQQLLAE